MSHMQKTVKMTLKGNTFRNGQVNRIFMTLKKKLNPGVVLTLFWAIYMYMTFIVKQAYWYILDLRLCAYRTIGVFPQFLLGHQHDNISLSSPINITSNGQF